jgi:hypothetical protein
MRPFLFAAAFFSTLAACDSPAPYSYVTDYAGNVYPPQCRQDLSALTVSVPVVEVEQPRLNRIASTTTGRPAAVYGLYIEIGKVRAIYVEKGLMGWKRADILHHERCHAYLDILGLDPNWHR